MATPDATLLGVNTAYYFNAVLEFAKQTQQAYDLCLITGDLAQDPCRESYQYMLSVLQKYPLPFTCLPGNHDDFGLMQAILDTDKIDCRKRIELGNWQIICLNSQIPDSPDGFLADSELSFLETALKERPDIYTLIAVHHNSLPCGSGWMDTMIIKNAHAFLELIAQYPMVKSVINGHIHQEMDIQAGTVRVLTTPSTCFQFKPQTDRFSLDDKSPGYRRIDLYNDGSIKTEVVRIAEPLLGLQTDTNGY